VTHNEDRIDGKSRFAGKLGPTAILNQNPIFEMDSGDFIKPLMEKRKES